MKTIVKTIGDFPRATDAKMVAVVFDQTPPDFGLSPSTEWLTEAHAWYADKAKALVDVLQEHAPQGFVDHLLAELCARRASVLRVR